MRPYLRALAQRGIEDPLQAKLDGSDIVQESMLNATRAFNRFDGQSPKEMQAWLGEILANVLANHRRKFQGTQRRQVAREVSIDGDSRMDIRGKITDRGKTPSQYAMGKERRRKIDAALDQLPEHYQDIIRMRSELRLPFEEIARRTGRTPDGARMLWGRAVRKLKEQLESAP